MRTTLLLAGFLLLNTFGFAQTNWFEGTWQEAYARARKENKHLFIDCYTDWCGWCKVADKNTFPAEEVAAVLNGNFISVKVDMERGDGVALGARYRVLGYPSYLMFTPEGKLAGKMFGYKENPSDFAAEVKAVLDESNQPNYPSKLTDKVDFPDFYLNSFTNKDKEEKRKNPEEGEVEKWLSSQKDLMSEAAWSVMYKFPSSEKYTEQFLKNRKAYADAYGKVEVDEKISGIAFNMLQKAMKSQDEKDLEQVLDFADKYIEDELEASKSMYQLKFCEGKGDWSGYADCVQKLIDFYGFENFLGGINNYSWTIYLSVDNKDVLNKALSWMKRVVEQDPQYMYLDTYAALLFKSGNYDAALQWADKAIDAGKTAGEKVDDTEELRDQIKAALEGN
ncbi:MAG: thioredoxin family protein [Flavobacteriales bacterium]|nr:thioredoxin family protein [Flavobacteriales bacterium]